MNNKLGIKYIKKDAYITGGKYDGRLVIDLPYGYLQSLYNKKDITDDLKNYLDGERSLFDIMKRNTNFMNAYKNWF